MISARLESTKEKRLKEAMGYHEKGKKLPMK
jgi:hypothetical protein